MKELYNVTLAWGWDKNDGNYTTSVWAEDMDEAIRLTAEEMADSGSMQFNTEKERKEWINDCARGFSDVYKTSDQFKGDMNLLFANEIFPAGSAVREINLVELGKLLAENRERILIAA